MMDMRSIVQQMLDSATRLALRQRSSRGEEGSAIIETALSIVVLFTFLIGIMETGLALYSYHFIADAAREGARYAIVRGHTAGTLPCAAPPNYATCIAQGGINTGDIATYVKTLGFPGINPSYMAVTSTWSQYVHGTTCPTLGPCNSPGNLVTVIVTYNFPLNLPFFPPKAFAMSSTAAMIIQQ
jgi:Flp pilus assembly protein TadG